MKNYIFLFICVVSIFMTACKKDGLLTYNQEESGSSIYFLFPFNSNADTSKIIALGYVPESTTDTVIGIPIRTTGILYDVDRRVSLDIDTGTTMVKGVHYDIIDSTLRIRKNRVVDTAKIILHRTADMKLETFALNIKLNANESFQLSIPGRTLTNGTFVPFTKYRLTCDDILGMPFFWYTSPYSTYAKNYLGDYSREKFALMLEVIGIDPTLFTDPDKASLITAAIISYWGSYMKYWLGKEAVEGRYYYDGNGNLLTMGQYAS